MWLRRNTPGPEQRVEQWSRRWVLKVRGLGELGIMELSRWWCWDWECMASAAELGQVRSKASSCIAGRAWAASLSLYNACLLSLAGDVAPLVECSPSMVSLWVPSHCHINPDLMVNDYNLRKWVRGARSMRYAQKP